MSSILGSLRSYARSFFTSAPVSSEHKQLAKDKVEVRSLPLRPSSLRWIPSHASRTQY